METHHGVALHLWNRAKEEIRTILVSIARRKALISYSDLASKVRAVPLGPDSHALHEMLGEISVEEDTGHRGMLSVLVVHKTGDQQPGRGFFQLAERLNRDTSDVVACWITEMNAVYAFHARRPNS